MRHIAVFVALCMTLSACGFRLRGDVSLPSEMQSTFISYAGTDAALRRTIARALALSGVSVARSDTEAGALLRLFNAGVGQRVLAKDSSGRPREYEISAVLVYDVVAADGARIVARQEVSQRSTIVLNPAEPLANAGDVQRAVEGLREAVVWEMLRRIAAAEPLPRDESPPAAMTPDAQAVGNDESH